MNRAVTKDQSPLIEKVVPVCRIMNHLVVTREKQNRIPWPADFNTYRGLGMPREHFGFFTVGKVYRAPMFVASSSRREVAESFMTQNACDGKCAVMFTIQFH